MKKKPRVKILIYLSPYSSTALLNITLKTLSCSTDAWLKQQTRLLFNQLRWMCAEHFLMHRDWGSVPGSVVSAKSKQHYANAISAAKSGRWVTERDASTQTDGQADANSAAASGWGWEVCVCGGGGGYRPWYHICAIFCTNLCESAQPTQRGCVVTPWTRRTSQNSTFVMSCSRGCNNDADWPAHFHCLTTWLTFEPRWAIFANHVRMHKDDCTLACRHVSPRHACVHHIQR